MADPYSTGGAAATRSTATRMGQAAAGKIDETRPAAADGLESAASSLHQKADSLPGGDTVRSAAHKAADALSSTADYVREKDVRGMLNDVQQIVKNNPGASLLTAAVLGFLVARSLSRN